MKTININLLVAAIALAVSVHAQVPVPAKAQEKPIVLTGGIAHLGNGQVIQNAVVGFDGRKITLVADASDAPDISGFEEIKINGQHIYPGLILPDSQLGLMEVSSIRAMNDFRETGDINPNVRSLVAYNTDSELIPTMRFNGILLVETAPTGGLIPGTSSVMELEGWDWEEAVHTADVAVHLNWPTLTTWEIDYRTFSYKEIPNKDYDKDTRTLDRFFAEASVYAKLEKKERNLKMEAMQDVFTGKKPLMIHAGQPKEIVASILFAKKLGVEKVILSTGSGALRVASFLKENDIPVILASTHLIPERTDDDIDMPYKLPHLLTEAGLTVCLAAEGRGSGARNLAFFAGTAAAYGMDKEEALKTITSNTAKALGIDASVGTLEVGKDATLFVSAGDVLDYRSSIVSMAFIRGRNITLPNKQQLLFERYSEKYGHGK